MKVFLSSFKSQYFLYRYKQCGPWASFFQDSFENNMKKFERIFFNFPLLRTFELMNDVIHGPLVDMYVHCLSVALSAWKPLTFFNFNLSRRAMFSSKGSILVLLVKGIVPTILVYKLNNFFFNKKVEISLNIN